MSNGIDETIVLLEEKVARAADLIRKLREQNQQLEDDLGKVRPRLLDAEKKIDALEKAKGAAAEETKRLDGLAQELKALRKEREEVKARIGRLVEVLEALD